MPLSVFRKLRFAQLAHTTVTLQLTDHSIRYPIDIVEDMLVKVDKFYFLMNLLVLYMEKDIRMPIILCKGFLVTRGALIDVPEKKLTLRVSTDVQEFKVFETLKCSSYDESCCHLDVINAC